MSPHRHQLSLSTQVLVELVLEGNEGVVTFLSEGDVSEDGGGYVGTDGLDLEVAL